MQSEEPRRVRVFVSSTFRDMQVERDELAKRVFPQLRKLCEDRDIEWGEVDLRWGITEKQAERGELLPICLAEIDRCRPYIIGILGERYGWVPEEISQELRNERPWLNEHLESSVTALEILHGVLNNPKMADHSFFYFRDKNYISKIPDTSRPDFLESATKEEIQRYGNEEAQNRAETRKEKLLKLKKDIQRSGLPVRENYQDPKEFATLVLNDLKEVIEKFPPPRQLDAHGRESVAHDTFARSRFGVYIERQQYFDALDTHAEGNGPPMIILGESGSGKSALLAHWVKRYQKRIQSFSNTEKESHFKPLYSLFTGSPPQVQQPLVLVHFIGATAESTDYVAMLRRIMEEFKQYFSINQDIPETSEGLRAAFPNWLHMAAARGKVVLVIDALNQIDDRDGAPDLIWLPAAIPPQIRFILSTLPGRSLDNLKVRGWPTLEVLPLVPDERKNLIRSYLAQYRRTPSDELIERISKAPQSANPLYLRSLLEELRLYGDHFTLMAEAERYLAAETIDDLFELILKRWEKDYNRDRPDLVQDVMRLLWAARRGLSEPELLDILGRDRSPIPIALWSPLSLAAEKSLVNRSGLFSFFHEYLRMAVEDRYLSSDSACEQSHLRIAEYFIIQPDTRRKVEELPWQLEQGKSWNQLFDLLRNDSFFTAAWAMNQNDIKKYWVSIEKNSSMNKLQAYQILLDNPEKGNPDFIFNVATLFFDTGYRREALKLRNYLLDYYSRTNDFENFQSILGHLGFHAYQEGNLVEAMNLYKKQEEICRRFGDRRSLQNCLGNQGLILRDTGYPDKAMRFHKEKERICSELGNMEGMAISLHNQAVILYNQGNYDEALKLYKKEEQICRELGDIEGLAASLGNQALPQYIRGNLEAAMVLHKEEERIYRELGNKDGLQCTLGNQGIILKDMGDFDGAMELYKKQELICRELGKRFGLQGSLGNQGIILLHKGDLDGAMLLFKQSEQICREMRNKEDLQSSLHSQAYILGARGDFDEALIFCKEAEEICQDLGNRDGLQKCLGLQGLIHHALGKNNEAMNFYKEQERICREIGNKSDLAISFSNQALLLAENPDQILMALQLAEEAQKIILNFGMKSRVLKMREILENIRQKYDLINSTREEDKKL